MVTPSAVQTTGKYPEYHMFWKDDILKVLAIFGKFEKGATSNNDPGINSYNNFIRYMSSMLHRDDPKTTPIPVPRNPGVDIPDVEIRATLLDGKRVQINALLVDSFRTADKQFYTRYEALSGGADQEHDESLIPVIFGELTGGLLDVEAPQMSRVANFHFFISHP